MDPTIFPEPEEFIPERWLKAQESGHRLDRYLVAFTKGSRSCLGIKYVSPNEILDISFKEPKKGKSDGSKKG